MKPRLFITGASGYLGRHLARRAVSHFEVTSAAGSRLDRIGAGHGLRLDLSQPTEVWRTLERYRPEIIIHCAAANPGTPEQRMMAVNHAGSAAVADAAARLGARLVHISSDAIFDGLDPPYDESCRPSPVDAYGRSKAAAEAAVAEIAPEAVIVRTSLIYGLEEIDRSNAGFIEQLQRGQVLKLWTDVIRQPIWVETLVAALLELADANLGYRGVLNIAGRQALSRWEFGRRMLAYWGVADHPNMKPGRAAEQPQAIPLDLRLDLRRAEAILSCPLRGVDEVLGASQIKP